MSPNQRRAREVWWNDIGWAEGCGRELRLALDAGADLLETGSDGATILHQAIWRNVLEAVVAITDLSLIHI